MSQSAADFYEAGLALPPSVRKEVALRLLESIEVADQDEVDNAWSNEISSRVDDILNGTVQTVSGERVFADLAAHRAARLAARDV